MENDDEHKLLAFSRRAQNDVFSNSYRKLLMFIFIGFSSRAGETRFSDFGGVFVFYPSRSRRANRCTGFKSKTISKPKHSCYETRKYFVRQQHRATSNSKIDRLFRKRLRARELSGLKFRPPKTAARGRRTRVPAKRNINKRKIQIIMTVEKGFVARLLLLVFGCFPFFFTVSINRCDRIVVARLRYFSREER